MCIGIPMQVVEQYEFSARCRSRNGEEEVSTLLTGPQKPGAWILVAVGTAREMITAEDAGKIDRALDALEAIARGDEIEVDDYFPDLS
ncbi:MAG: HypC/HybG/HupF family hydrogenase formation chaperone [Gammaproteobacteria bacterium]|nr:HypC/HybG/HupF family hydrogenase formation chaperone [Gammaproteobacteria bacterium]